MNRRNRSEAIWQATRDASPRSWTCVACTLLTLLGCQTSPAGDHVATSPDEHTTDAGVHVESDASLNGDDFQLVGVTEAAAVYVTTSTAGSSAVAATGGTACVASGVCIAVVVVGAVVVAGSVALVIRARNRSDERRLAESPRVDVRVGRATVVGRGGYATGPLLDLLYRGLSLGARSRISPLHEIHATRYVDACQSPAFRGGAACVSQARSYLSCVSYGGGNACANRLNAALSSAIAAVSTEIEAITYTVQGVSCTPGNLFTMTGRGGMRLSCVCLSDGNSARCTEL
ncbi:MAG: hypothetical protein H6724_19075 [Sandaracinus sp.]|nr:hypothetical protein [Sandaracinus sp.]